MTSYQEFFDFVLALPAPRSMSEEAALKQSGSFFLASDTKTEQACAGCRTVVPVREVRVYLPNHDWAAPILFPHAGSQSPEDECVTRLEERLRAQQDPPGLIELEVRVARGYWHAFEDKSPQERLECIDEGLSSVRRCLDLMDSLHPSSPIDSFRRYLMELPFPVTFEAKVDLYGKEEPYKVLDSVEVKPCPRCSTLAQVRSIEVYVPSQDVTVPIPIWHADRSDKEGSCDLLRTIGYQNKGRQDTARVMDRMDRIGKIFADALFGDKSPRERLESIAGSYLALRNLLALRDSFK